MEEKVNVEIQVYKAFYFKRKAALSVFRMRFGVLGRGANVSP